MKSNNNLSTIFLGIPVQIMNMMTTTKKFSIKTKRISKVIQKPVTLRDILMNIMITIFMIIKSTMPKEQKKIIFKENLTKLSMKQNNRCDYRQMQKENFLL